MRHTIIEIVPCLTRRCASMLRKTKGEKNKNFKEIHVKHCLVIEDHPQRLLRIFIVLPCTSYFFGCINAY